MFKIATLNKIADIGLSKLGDNFAVTEDINEADGVLVRSASMHDMEIPATLKAVARAGAGTNNIPLDKFAEKGIVVFNTPGANANAVKELATCALFLASRDITGGIKWAETLKDEGDAAPKLVEKGKSQFAGPEIMGKTLGLVGLGAIGAMVANTALSLGMKVIGYDPYITPAAAWSLAPSIKQAATYEDIFKTCDYITLHVPATAQTKNMICEKTLSMMKDGVKIINLARAELVNAEDMKKALAA